MPPAAPPACLGRALPCSGVALEGGQLLSSPLGSADSADGAGGGAASGSNEEGRGQRLERGADVFRAAARAGGGGGAARQDMDGLWTEVCGQQKQSNDPGNNQHILNTPIIGRR